jgi:hypothetical protein
VFIGNQAPRFWLRPKTDFSGALPDLLKMPMANLGKTQDGGSTLIAKA